MSFKQFAGRALGCRGVGVPEDVREHTGLCDDLGFDSLQALHLLFEVEGLAGCDVPPPELPEMFTLGDAYGYCNSLVRIRAGLT